MKYPTLSEMQTSREWLDVFRGYNHNLRIAEGEFYEMENLSSDNYPILSPRSQRGVYVTPNDMSLAPYGMVAKDSLVYLAGTNNIVINGAYYNIELTKEYDKNGKLIPKTLISMGAYVIIMPDKKYIRILPDDESEAFETGNIEASFTTKGAVYFELCDMDGNLYRDVVPSDTAPPITDEMKKDPSKIPTWLDTSETPHQLKVYSTSTSMWSSYPTTYIKISCNDTGFTSAFETNDGVSISGVEDDALQDLNASMVIWAKGNNYIVVKGIIDELTMQTSPITITRKMPNMDFIIESGNRLWGCRYGVALNGEIVNEIYASKLGDFKNWNCFAGISTDSYVATIGTDGQFTGATTHLGYPIFFKENYMHKVYGNYPANYQIQTTACRGVQKGCDRSLAIVNEVLYYKSRSGICAYDGSLPQEISSALGGVPYSKAVAGALGNKYYVSMMDSDARYHLFVYDTSKGMWHREDSTEALDFCTCRGDLYFIDWNGGQIKTVNGTGLPETEPIKWSATTGIIGTDSPDKKYISRLDVRMMLAVGSRVTFFIEYDSSGTWDYLFTMDGISLKSFPVPIKPRRCDHMRLKIVGNGDAKIYSICKTIEWGSDK